MCNRGSVLIADDEETFREATCRLLRQEGFECTSAADAEEAVRQLRERAYDVLVADIRMPRNPDLRVAREARRLDGRMGVILVTGYPTVETAVRSVELLPTAYLTKPLDFDELMRHIRTSVENSRCRRSLAAVQQRLQLCFADLDVLGSGPPTSAEAGGEFVPLTTIRTLASCLSELLELSAAAARRRGLRTLCQLLDCPQRPAHRDALVETIEVLKKTKETFKSKTLADLRVGLESLVGTLS